jgi:thymidylate kinase
LLIEICGPDGSGKSTLVDGLRARVRLAGGTAYERTLRSESRNLMELVQHGLGPDAFASADYELAVLLDAVAQSTGELSKYRGAPATHVFVQHYHCALLARMYRRGLDDRRGLRGLLSQVPAPDLSLRLVVSGDTCLDRIQRRTTGDGLLARSSPRAELHHLVDAYDAAAGALPYPCMNLDAELPAADLLAAAWAHVHPSLDPSARPPRT